jgi:hypothetical protein
MADAVLEKPKSKAVVTLAVAPTTTTVTGTLTDIGGQLWVSAYITALFYPVPNVPGPYLWGGETFSQVVQFKSGIDGTFSVSLQDNLTITPLGSMWQFIISPNATMPAVVFNLMIAGTSMDISSVFTNQSYQVQGSLVQPIVLPRAYTDNEVVFPPFAGGLYYNATNHQLMLFTGAGGWISTGGGYKEVPPNTDANSTTLSGFVHCQTGFLNGPTAFNGQPTTIMSIVGMQLCTSGVTDNTSFYYRVFYNFIPPSTGVYGAWLKVTGI